MITQERVVIGRDGEPLREERFINSSGRAGIIVTDRENHVRFKQKIKEDADGKILFEGKDLLDKSISINGEYYGCAPHVLITEEFTLTDVDEKLLSGRNSSVKNPYILGRVEAELVEAGINSLDSYNELIKKYSQNKLIKEIKKMFDSH